MRHQIHEYTDSVHVSGLGIGPKGETSLKFTVVNTEGKTRFTLTHDTAWSVAIVMSEIGRLRFERAMRGQPVEYLQVDKVTGEIRWQPEKPYSSSGRDYVEVALGLDVVLG